MRVDLPEGHRFTQTLRHGAVRSHGPDLVGLEAVAKHNPS
ncbi:MAG: hypothetical protein BWZ07_00061 [Alphaproteobacteria bacterium ADurb.BinA280]|nr:MAG: hypothetical protein BWZ07_00061 [Alphaproteobacteria bacterium ADurb.BinA280]